MWIRVLTLGLLALALAFAACGGSSDGKKSAPSTTKSSPSTGPGTTGGLKMGDEVTADGTRLSKPPNPDTRQIDPELACRTFVEAADGNCDIVMMAGGNALWTVEPMAESGTGERA